MKEEEWTIRDGRELKRVLRVAGYSQRELAEHMNFSRSYVNAVCNGLSPLTLRVIEAVKTCLGPTLYVLAIKRARLLEIEERKREEERRRVQAAEFQYRREQEQKREEERRQAAIDALREELEGAGTSDIRVIPNANHESEDAQAGNVMDGVHSDNDSIDDSGDEPAVLPGS